ncbi:DUF6368 family protein [Streptomyces sp. NPDC058655]|uniref:DUF6368 family protein n=1 Tax=Streptomyces sp. NPDC058655 TaxID=3346577 RepID=UPI00365321A2
MSGPTLVIELAEPLSPAALREFRVLISGLSSHFDEKRPGFFDVNVPAERLGVEDRRGEDWRKPFPLPLLGNATADEELTVLVGFNPQREGLASALPGLLDAARCRRREHLRG